MGPQMANLPVLGGMPDPVQFERFGGASRSIETTKVIERIVNGFPIESDGELGSPELFVVELQRVTVSGRTYPWLINTWSVRGTRSTPDDEDIGDRFAWGVDELGEDNPYYKRAVAILDEYREAADGG